MSVSKRGRDLHADSGSDEADEAKLDAEDERLFTTAKALEFGDWNVGCLPTPYKYYQLLKRA